MGLGVWGPALGGAGGRELTHDVTGHELMLADRRSPGWGAVLVRGGGWLFVRRDRGAPV